MTAPGIVVLVVGGVALLGLGVTVGGLWARRRADRLDRRYRDLEREARELREACRELRASYAELQSSEAAQVNDARVSSVGSLVAGVAHEMNTPLGALNASHDTFRRALDRLQDILADERVDPEELEEVRRIVRAVDRTARTQDLAFERLAHVVDELRAFGRPDDAEISVVDLHDGLESTLTVLGHELGDRIVVERRYGDLPPVECHPHRLNQVFLNLLSNAIHAIHGPGTIVVGTDAGDGQVTVAIEDSGVGIPEEDLPKIFDAGFTTRKERKGMGLGLLISQQIVHQHGGRIEVESRPGEGSTFRVRLPVRIPASGARAGGAGEAGP
ncbi:MAG TPA: ATP-binding protein [Gemmatimonadota bacterium]|nr:ATP-binding protein [Gemmatimonadota bacterium]